MRAQSARDGFDQFANGTIRAVVVQPDGKILLGGDFTTLSPNGGAGQGGAIFNNTGGNLMWRPAGACPSNKD